MYQPGTGPWFNTKQGIAIYMTCGLPKGNPIRHRKHKPPHPGAKRERGLTRSGVPRQKTGKEKKHHGGLLAIKIVRRMWGKRRIIDGAGSTEVKISTEKPLSPQPRKT